MRAHIDSSYCTIWETRRIAGKLLKWSVTIVSSLLKKY